MAAPFSIKAADLPQKKLYIFPRVTGAIRKSARYRKTEGTEFCYSAPFSASVMSISLFFRATIQPTTRDVPKVTRTLRQ